MKLRSPIAAVLSIVAGTIVGCQFGSGSAEGGGAGSSETGSGGGGTTSGTANTAALTSDSTGEGVSAGEGTTATVEEGPGDETVSADGSSGSSSSDTGTDTGGTGDPVGFGPFDPPELVPFLSEPGSNEDDPSFRVDELEVYFNSDRFSNARIMVSQRLAVTDSWDPPTVEETLSENASDTTPELSEDGLIMVISSDRATGFQDLFVSSRTEWNSTWSDPVALSDFSSGDQHLGGTLFGDEMYFCQSEVTKGDEFSLNLWRVDVVDAVGGMFGVPELVEELNRASFDCTVALSSDRREIIFERSQAENPGFELMRSERADAGDIWSPPTPITELNGSTDDSDPWLSTDGRRLYFASPRDGDTFDIYMARRQPL